MYKIILGVILTIAWGFTFGLVQTSYALGLTTSFSQVTLEGLETGSTYSSKETAGGERGCVAQWERCTF